MSSVTDHPGWPLLRPYLRIERYGRDPGALGARARLEIDAPEDGITLRRLLGLVMPCVACGAPIHPVRVRQGGRGMYFAAACGLDVGYRCARGAAASAEYLRVIEAVETWRDAEQLAPPPQQQARLF